MSTQQALDTTPPESLTSPPLTPPPTDEKTNSLVLHIIEEIKARRGGRGSSINPWTSYTLGLAGYKDLLQLLRRDESLWAFVYYKLRYDYFSSDTLLVLRMNTALHETVIINVVEELWLQLKSIAGGGNQSAAFAREIKPGGSAKIVFADSEFSRHVPDGQFCHSQAQYPGVVIEVSYAQKRKDLARLADDYILGSNGDIRVLIGLDVEYRGSKKATISIWRPRVVRNEAGEGELVAMQTVTDQMFRDENGSPVRSEEAGLILQLQDFATTALVELHESLKDPISISADALCAFVESAEKRDAVVEQGKGVVNSTKTWVRKRRRESTPPEELAQEHERRFREDEERAVERAAVGDSSYSTSPVSEAGST